MSRAGPVARVGILTGLIVAILAGLVHPAPPQPSAAAGPSPRLTIQNGQIARDGRPFAVRVAWPNIAFGPSSDPAAPPDACAALIGTPEERSDCLDYGKENPTAYLGYPKKLRALGFNAVKVNLHWNQFDAAGDGEITDRAAFDRVLAFMDEADRQGLHVVIAFVLGAQDAGGIPRAFFAKHPESAARDVKGNIIYSAGYRAKYPDDPHPPFDRHDRYAVVPSFFDEAYLATSRRFMKAAIAELKGRPVLFFETCVEPQYLGEELSDYSAAARRAWESAGRTWPPEESTNPQSPWHRWRAEQLAEWVAGDARAIREVAGEGTLIAIDHLVATDDLRRKGDSAAFLSHLSRIDAGATPLIDIVQVNWHLPSQLEVLRQEGRGTRSGFDHARSVNQTRVRPWAVTEHMTWVGGEYDGESWEAVLRHAFANDTRFGFEIFNTRPVDEAFTAAGPEPVGGHRATYFNAYAAFDRQWRPKGGLARLTEAVPGADPAEAPMSLWVSRAISDTTPPRGVALTATLDARPIATETVTATVTPIVTATPTPTGTAGVAPTVATTATPSVVATSTPAVAQIASTIGALETVSATATVAATTTITATAVSTATMTSTATPLVTATPATTATVRRTIVRLEAVLFDDSEVGSVRFWQRAATGGPLFPIGVAMAGPATGRAALDWDHTGFDGPRIIVADYVDAAGNACRSSTDPAPGTCGVATAIVDLGQTPWQRAFVPLVARGLGATGSLTSPARPERVLPTARPW